MVVGDEICCSSKIKFLEQKAGSVKNISVLESLNNLFLVMGLYDTITGIDKSEIGKRLETVLKKHDDMLAVVLPDYENPSQHYRIYLIDKSKPFCNLNMAYKELMNLV